jgi:Kef-type K+ transport system membrane component KefB
MLGLQQANLHVGPSDLPPDELAAIGFIILVAFATGQLFKRFDFPALLGYIIAGIAFGPKLAEALPFVDQALFSDRVIDDLSLINVLTVGVIGMLGGGELKISDLKHNYTVVLSVVALFFLSVIPLTAVTVFGVAHWAPSLAPFMQELGLESQLFICVLLGVFGFAMSPAATLAVIQENKAKGRFTSTALGVVIVADLVLVASFVFTMAFGEMVLGPGEFTTAAIMAELPTIGMEFFWAIVIGAGAGLALILYLRFVASEVLLFTIAVIFVGTYLVNLLHAETLLAFLTAGFIVQNFSRQGDDMIHAIERISLPVFVIYFMIQAAQLDLAALQVYFPLTVILTLVRTATLYGGTKFATKWTKADSGADSDLWMAFVSRGGVDIVLAAIVANRMGGWGQDFQAVVMALVLVHIIAGPVLLKYALTNAGDIKGEESDDSADKDLETIGDSSDDITPEIEFDFPDISDDEFRGKLESIHQKVLDCHRSCVTSPVERRHEQIRESLQSIDTIITETVERLDQMCSSDNDIDDVELRESIRQLHLEHHRRLQPHIDTLSDLNPMALTPQTARNILATLQDIVEFDSEHKTSWSAESIEQSNVSSGQIRTWLQRVQRTIGTRSPRTVPLGQLWRYYVELAVPMLLADAIEMLSEENENFWHELSIHIRRVDHTFERILSVLESPDENNDADGTAVEARIPVTVMNKRPGTQQPEISSEEYELDAGEESHEHLKRLLKDTRDYFESHQQNLVDQLDAFSSKAIDAYTYSIAKPYKAFLQGVLEAGMVEQPAFRYRPSQRFDEAREARRQLSDRLEREEQIVTSYQGWLTIEHELSLFLHWFAKLQDQIKEDYTSLLEDSGLRALRDLRSLCEDSVKFREHTFEDKLMPQIVEANQLLTNAKERLSDAVISRKLIDEVKIRVSELTKETEILRKNPADPHHPPSPLEKVNIPFRNWFREQLVRKIAFEFIELDQQLEQTLERSLLALDDIEELLVAYSRGVEPGGLDNIPEQIANSQDNRDVFNYIDSMIGEAIELLESDRESFQETIQNDIREVLGAALDPFREQKFGRIISTSVDGVKEKEEGLVQRIPRAANNLKYRAKQELGRFKEAVRQEFDASPVRERRLTDGDIRSRLMKPSWTISEDIPPIYRRLFSSTPLDISGFYISRPKLKREVIEILHDWNVSKRNSLLVTGQRGIGKRMFVHRVIPQHLEQMHPGLGSEALETINLSHNPQTEERLCKELSNVFGGLTFDNLNEAADALSGLASRRVVILENADKIYTRTERGLERIKSFLDMVDRTSGRIFWIFLMNRAQASLLQTLMGLKHYFKDTVEVPPIERSQIENLILSRHKASGYALEFKTPEQSIYRDLLSPIESFHKKNASREVYFDRLQRISYGNPKLALLNWLESADVSSGKDKRIQINPIEELTGSFTHNLSLEQRIILATLIQHSSLTFEQMQDILERPKNELKPDLNYLENLFFIEQISGTRSYALTDKASPIVTRELRDQNML